MTATHATAFQPDAEAAAPVTPQDGVTGAGSSGRARTAGAILSWLLLAVAVVALWPAQWGGVVGLTIVSGHSMEPGYHTGDLIVTTRQADYAVGDVISYRVPQDQPGAGGRVIHRIVSIQSGVISTRGDNNADSDPWVVSETDVTGRAAFLFPGIGLLWGPGVLPLILAGITGLGVTVWLWPSKPGPEPEVAVADEDATDA